MMVPKLMYWYLRRRNLAAMSMPPVVKWRYDWHPEPGSAEAELYDRYLKPQDWA